LRQESKAVISGTPQFLSVLHGVKIDADLTIEKWKMAI
jgi:hypothetical protein